MSDNVSPKVLGLFWRFSN